MRGVPFRLLPRAAEACGARIAERVARAAVRLGWSPDAITIFGLVPACGAGYFLWRGRPFWSGLLIVLVGSLDVLDGAAARRAGRITRFGALLDSTVDRYAEFALYFGLALHFRGRPAEGLAALAFLGSVMVSYTRARAEGLGFECREGVLQRAERLILLGLGCLVACFFPIFDEAMITALGLIAVLSNATALQRLRLIRRRDRG